MDYDVVIAGAGSAGGVIAARATENSNLRVLLLEAGPDYPGRPSVPDDLLNGHHNSVRDHDWGFVYQPAPAIRADVPLPRGKVTGGSSSVNTAIALRGQPEDYDEWAALGLPEWSWDRCLPAFIRLEADHDMVGPLHGKSGPIPIRRPQGDELTPFQRAAMQACAALGFPACPDHNDPATTGYGPHPMNKQGRLRVGVLLTYLAAARTRPNLTIRPETLVRRVLLQHGRVSGVEVESGDAVEVIPCHRLIISAGAIQTPAILVRSGIGPRATLERLGIEVIRDLPGVGARLLDHPAASVTLTPRAEVCSVDQPLIQTTLRYTASGSNQFNDMQLEPLSWVQRGVVGIETGDTLLLALAAVLEKPRGHGRLRFPSASPTVQPVIEPDFLEDRWDLERVVEGLELAARLAETAEVRAVASGIHRPQAAVLNDREALRGWARRACGSGYHPCGTTPMGPEGDPEAVVDQYGRVRGVAGLLVADAGIMPTIPRANTNIPTIMIGERFGAWLRDGAI